MNVFSFIMNSDGWRGGGNPAARRLLRAPWDTAATEDPAPYRFLMLFLIKQRSSGIQKFLHIEFHLLAGVGSDI